MSINSISPIQLTGVQNVAAAQQNAPVNPADKIVGTFADMLDTLSTAEVQSNDMVSQVAAGKNVDLHDMMIGLETTDIQFRVAMSIRDKLVDAYHEVMRMQV